MAGGAQFAGDVLQGIFGGDNINTSPAAGAYKVMPEDALADLNRHNSAKDPGFKPYGSIQDAVNNNENIKSSVQYYRPDTGENVTQYVKSPDDLLPMKKPGFLQRAFAPYDASRANSINSSYATQPSFATQADRTAGLIGAGHAARVQAFLNGDQSATETDPLTAFYANNGDTSVAGFNRTQTNALDYDKGVPDAASDRDLISAQTGTQVQGNVGDYARGFADQGGPGAEATRDVTGAVADTGINKAKTHFQPAMNTLTGKTLQADTGDIDSRIATQPERAKEALFKAQLGSILAGKEREMAPSLANALQNRIGLDEIDSRYGQAPVGPVGMYKNPDGSWSYGKEPFLNTQMGNYEGMKDWDKLKDLGRISGIDANGKRVSFSNVPIKTFDVNGATRPTVGGTPTTPNDPDYAGGETNSPVTVDKEGNLWKDGKIYMTKEQIANKR